MNTFLEKYYSNSLNPNIKLLKGPQELYTGLGHHYFDEAHINNSGHRVLYEKIKAKLENWEI